MAEREGLQAGGQGVEEVSAEGYVDGAEVLNWPALTSCSTGDTSKTWAT
jgi:hypothetical protein